MKPIKYKENLKNDGEKFRKNDLSFIKNYGVHNNEQMFSRGLAYNFLFKILSINHSQILDLGSGFGHFTNFFGIIGDQVHGFDCFKEALHHSKARNQFKNIKYKFFDIHKEDIKISFYNLIFCREFHPITRNYYSDEQNKKNYHDLIISKIFSGLKKDGHLIIVNNVSQNNIVIEDFIENKFETIIRYIDETGLMFSSFFYYFLKNDFFFILISRFIFYLRKVFSKMKITKPPIEIIILKKLTN